MNDLVVYQPPPLEGEIERPLPAFDFVSGDKLLFTIHRNGRIERGPAFTTIDEMSLEFWGCVERHWRKTGRTFA